MTYFIICLICLLACSVGSICGMGGGVIIKPTMDALGILPVSTISFLSGCTVIGMTSYSVARSFQKKESIIDLTTSTPLAIGSALGGILGKQLFLYTETLFETPDTAGGVQAILLFFATGATLIYTIRKDKLSSKKLHSIVPCVIVGFLLGTFSSYLGIGGGPFNVAVFCYFFSMTTKAAAQNSLYVILFSQFTATAETVICGKVPDFSIVLLILMILCGILGSIAGRTLNKKLSEKAATYLLEGMMVLIMGISVFNGVQFLYW